MKELTLNNLLADYRTALVSNQSFATSTAFYHMVGCLCDFGYLDSDITDKFYKQADELEKSLKGDKQ